MIGNRSILSYLLAAVLAATTVAAGAAPLRVQDEDPKEVRLLGFAKKAGITDADRRIASVFLAAHYDEFRSAPVWARSQVRTMHVWTRDCDRYAVAVPHKLDAELSELPDGFVYRIFDRSLILVSRESGEVVDIVDAADE